MNIDTSIFKAYDIRGIYPDSLNEATIDRIARAYAVFIQKENPGKTLSIVVGHDMRLSGPSLTKTLIQSLREQGVNVIDIGLASTPTMYFATAFYGYDGGIQVSASHNPSVYNGLKMVRARAVPISSETGLFEIRSLAANANFTPSATLGSLSQKTDVLPDLIHSQAEEWQIKATEIKPFKIVIDAANSMGAIDYQEFFKFLPGKLIKVNFDLDGSFPSHQPDPLVPENLQLLTSQVIKNSADLGIGPDGDGDRIFFVDEKGTIVRQDVLRGLLAQQVLNKYPRAPICYDIRPGRITKDLIEQAGGKPVVTRVGHTLIKEKMLRVGAPYGGESSGHYFFRFSYGTFESPFIMLSLFLKFLSAQNKSLSQIIQPQLVYFQSGEINSEVSDKQGKIAALKQKYSDASKINEMDGITITYPDYWFNVRPSNTENLLRLNLEAKSPSLMAQKRDEILDFIRS